MKDYIVKQPFTNIDGAFKRVGDTVQCDDGRASVLRRFGKIGGTVETATKVMPEPIRVESESLVENATVDESAVEKRGRGRPSRER